MTHGAYNPPHPSRQQFPGIDVKRTRDRVPQKADAFLPNQQDLQKSKQDSISLDSVLLPLRELQPKMRKFRPIVSGLDEVIITREKDAAVIQYKDPAYGTTHFQIGPEVGVMTDQQIVDLFNDSLRAQAQLAAEYKHLVVEIPLGSPQIEYQTDCDQWTPRGDVLRCLIDDTANGEREPVIIVDDKEISWREFGRLVCTYAGWGMRIEFVSDDKTHRRPTLEVRQPTK